MEDFKHKYLKYKNKYVSLKSQTGGNNLDKLDPSHDNGNGGEKVKRHLALYEILNFRGGNNQDWDIVRKIYDKDVVIRMANEPGMKGVEQNIEMMKEMYVAAPDTKVIRHEVQFGSGDWIAVEQVMSGTFTGPMKTPNGKVYQPTGNKFEMRSCSLVCWKDNKIVEETIFWDQENFAKQLGIPDLDAWTDPNKHNLCAKLSFVSFGRGDETDPIVRKHTVAFENFIFNGYNRKNWDLPKELHADNFELTYIDGKKLTGNNNLVKQMQTCMFPPTCGTDDKVISIPIIFGSGKWMAATILMGGTIPNSNGETWAIEHCSIIRWENDKIVEAHLYLDNTESKRQAEKL